MMGKFGWVLELNFYLLFQLKYNYFLNPRLVLFLTGFESNETHSEE